MRQLRKSIRQSLFLVAFAGSLYLLLTAEYLIVHPMQHGPIMVGWGLALCFAVFPTNKNDKRDAPSILDMLCIVLAIGISIYTTLNANRYIHFPQEATLIDIVVATLWVLLSSIAMWRSFGPLIPGLMIIMIIYAFYGQYFPGIWRHRGFTFWRVMEQLQTTNTGFWGLMLWVLITVVPLFMILANLIFSGVGSQLMIDIGKVTAGRIRGGAAQIAVVASALMGMVSGSAIANVATTGAFTIPLMKRSGYKPEFSGAVECAASSGGLIAPPIMAAGAFVMAEVLGVSYISVMKAAIVPAAIYFGSVSFNIYLEARKLGLTKLPSNEIPPIKEILQVRKLSPLIIPIIILIWLMVVSKLSVGSAGFWSIISCILSYLLASKNQKEMKTRFFEMIDSFGKTGYSIANIVVLGVVVQIVVAIVGLTGIAVIFTSLVEPAARISIILALAMTALATLVLGMGLPATAAYIVAVSVLGPSLGGLGLKMINVHMFIFYFSMLAAITPPVCAAVYVAVPIANSKLWETAWISVGLTSNAYIVAFLFAVDGRLLLDGSIFNVIVRGIVTLYGSVCICAAFKGYLITKLTLLQRILFFVAASVFLLWDLLNIQITIICAIGILTSGTGFYLNGYLKKGYKSKVILDVL